jgi:hypothetical protein
MIVRNLLPLIFFQESASESKLVISIKLIQR